MSVLIKSKTELYITQQIKGMSFNKSDDFYENLYANHPSKLISLSLTLVTFPLRIALTLGVIWYEHRGCDSKRNLRNRLASSVCFYIILQAIFGHIPWITRYIVARPLPKFICETMVFSMTFTWMQVG